MLTQIPYYQGSYEKKVWLASSKNPSKFKDEAKQTVSFFLQNTLSNYFEVESPNDKVCFEYTRSIKQTKKEKRKTKNHTSGIERFIPDNNTKKCFLLYTHLG
jgi:hypothetical protein